MGFTKSRDLLAAAAWSLASEVSLQSPFTAAYEDFKSNPGLERGREGSRDGVKGSVPSLWDRSPVPMEPLFSGTWQLGSGTRVSQSLAGPVSCIC